MWPSDKNVRRLLVYSNSLFVLALNIKNEHQVGAERVTGSDKCSAASMEYPSILLLLVGTAKKICNILAKERALRQISHKLNEFWVMSTCYVGLVEDTKRFIVVV